MGFLGFCPRVSQNPSPISSLSSPAQSFHAGRQTSGCFCLPLNLFGGYLHSADLTPLPGEPHSGFLGDGSPSSGASGHPGGPCLPTVPFCLRVPSTHTDKCWGSLPTALYRQDVKLQPSTEAKRQRGGSPSPARRRCPQPDPPRPAASEHRLRSTSSEQTRDHIQSAAFSIFRAPRTGHSIPCSRKARPYSVLEVPGKADPPCGAGAGRDGTRHLVRL